MLSKGKHIYSIFLEGFKKINKETFVAFSTVNILTMEFRK